MVANKLIKFFIINRDNRVYTKMTDYWCIEKEQLCLCNTRAAYFREMYNYKPTEKTIGWIAE
jgi:hypothetical protein